MRQSFVASTRRMRAAPDVLTLLKVIAGTMAFIAVAAALVAAWLWPRYPYLPATETPPKAERLLNEPLIHADPGNAAQAHFAEHGYVSITHPTLIRVPDWVEDPLGRYYLYFAHHKGGYIRLAYADDILGPWRTYGGGALALADSGFPADVETADDPARALADLRGTFSIHVVRDYLLLARQALADGTVRKSRGIAAAEDRMPHVASPELLVDDERQRLLMFYHGLEYGTRQLSRIAESKDGIRFTALDGTVPSPYVRHFEFRGRHYLLGMPGVLFCASQPTGPFEARDRLLFEPRMRHAGLLLDGATLYVFWSRAGDAPERILVSEVDLTPVDWDDWRATDGVEILRPELGWEGADLPVLPTLRGELANAANELRDPYVFADPDGPHYLLYVAGGEKALGIARLRFPDK